MNTSNATGAPPALPILNHTLGVGCRPYSASSSSRACAIVLHDPACDPGHSADYLRFYFCSDDPISEALFGGEASPIAPLLKLPLLLFWTTILFASIGVVADHFLAPAVARIARRMKLPEDVAGADALAPAAPRRTSSRKPPRSSTRPSRTSSSHSASPWARASSSPRSGKPSPSWRV